MKCEYYVITNVVVYDVVEVWNNGFCSEYYWSFVYKICKQNLI